MLLTLMRNSQNQTRLTASCMATSYGLTEEPYHTACQPARWGGKSPENMRRTGR
jgi:hypothetical protein